MNLCLYLFGLDSDGIGLNFNDPLEKIFNLRLRKFLVIPINSLCFRGFEFAGFEKNHFIKFKCVFKNYFTLTSNRLIHFYHFIKSNFGSKDNQ